MVENSVSAISGGSNGGSGRWAQISGFSFVWDSTQTSAENDDISDVLTTSGQRVWSITLDDGTKIVEDGAVVSGAPNVNLAVADFTARGGDQYDFSGLPLTIVGVSYQQALFNYVNQALNDTIRTADYPSGGEGRIRHKNLSSIENLQINDIRMFPNPANDQVFIDLSKTAEAWEISILDVNGKLVSATNASNELVSIQTTAFASGLYFVTLKSATRQLQTKLRID
jgi:hypothetical protein